jgi:enoyl-CoA hydratase/carnithine racemase
MPDYDQYPSLSVDMSDQVATVEILQPTPEEAWSTHFDDVSGALRDMRTDERIRIILIAGPDSHDAFYVSAPADAYETDEHRERILADEAHVPPDGATLMANEMLETEKIVVTKVNGDSFGSGTSLIFGSDFVVAEEDARIAEGHMDMRENDPERGYMPEWGVVPGGLAGSLIPLYLPPGPAKEMLMLGEPYTASELADWGIVNRAVPAEDIDETTAQLVSRLLDRSAHALAWTKRVANRRLVQHVNMNHDAARAYEWRNFYMVERRGWEDKFEFTDDS